MRASLLLFHALAFVALPLAAAAPCDKAIPGAWTGSRAGKPFNDVYALTWSSSGPASGSWEATLVSGAHDSWKFGSGQFALPRFNATTVAFDNGARETGSVSPSCDAITWSDKSQWAPLPPPPQPPACAAITSPAPCGQASDSAERCLSKGCCYNAAFAKAPCFYPGGNAVPITHVHVIQASHFDAGFAYTIKDVLLLWWYTLV